MQEAFTWWCDIPDVWTPVGWKDHLFRFIPLALLRANSLCRLERMATYYGPVSLTAKLSQEGKELDMTYSHSFRRTPERVVFHVPPVEGLDAIRVNGSVATIAA